MYVVPHHISACMLSHIIYLHVCSPTSCIYLCMYVVPHHVSTCTSMLSHIMYLYVCCPTSYIYMYVVPHHISTCITTDFIWNFWTLESRISNNLNTFCHYFPDQATIVLLYINLFVPFRYSLLKLLQKFGPLKRFDFLINQQGPEKGKPRGYSFVSYENRRVNLLYFIFEMIMIYVNTCDVCVYDSVCFYFHCVADM
jgi:hypothetical protein